MQRKWILAPVMATLAVAGCHHRTHGVSPDSREPPIREISAFKDCKVDSAKVAGTINIIIPNHIDGATISRRLSTNSEDPANPHPARVRYGPPLAEDDSGTGVEPGSRFTDNAPDANEPFDAFMLEPKWKTGFALVRVIIRNTDSWQFYNEGNFHGVGTYDKNDPVLCGVRDVKVKPGKSRQVAKFYIKLNKLFAEGQPPVPFAIGLVAGPPPDPNADEEKQKADAQMTTPIFIDPKIRNDGDGKSISRNGTPDG